MIALYSILIVLKAEDLFEYFVMSGFLSAIVYGFSSSSYFITFWLTFSELYLSDKMLDNFFFDLYLLLNVDLISSL